MTTSDGAAGEQQAHKAQHGPSPRAMLAAMLVAIALGAIVQLVPSLKPASEWTIEHIAGPLGQLFLRALFMLVVPLLFSGLVVGIAELDLRRLERIGARTLFYTVMPTGAMRSTMWIKVMLTSNRPWMVCCKLIAMMLGMLNVPVEGLGLILGVDRFLDMCRTTVNVTGDLAAAAYVARGEEAPA